MNIKNFFTKNWIHLAALVAFLLVTIGYFSPQFNGYALAQHDIQQFKGASHEISYYRETTGKEPLWTNSMFGGMPATQISVVHQGNIFKATITWFLRVLHTPAGVFLLHMICFYLMALMMRIRPLIAILGAFAFAFASYEIIIVQAGHNSKALAAAFAPPVLGAFYYAFKRNWKWGTALSAVFMAFELAMNHLQITYYMLILLFFVGVYYFVEALREKKIKHFMFATGGVIVAYILAGLVNYGNISMTNEYAKDSIRGGNDVAITPEGNVLASGEDGLDAEYITQWSYGIGESFTLISPYVKGSHSAALGNTRFMEVAENTDLPASTIKQLGNLPVYWGEQPMTSGPVYLGVAVVFLAFLGLVMLKNRIKWVLFGVAVLALMLSWGKNFMGLTDFFVEYVPAYNKFRTVTIILVLVELCIPVIGVLLLQQLWEERENLKEKKKHFLITSGVFLVFLITVKFAGLGDGYTSSGDERILDQYRASFFQQLDAADPAVLLERFQVDVNNEQQLMEFINQQMEPIESNMQDLRTVREGIFNQSMNRSILIAVFAIAVMSLFFFTAIPAPYIVAGMAVVVLADLIPVDTNYIGNEEDDRGNYVHWVPAAEQEYPIPSTQADLDILNAELAENPELSELIAAGEREGIKKADELGYVGAEKRRVVDAYRFSALNMNTDYRVFEIDGGAWGSSRASYFHKSLGGYHGAKLRNIQNLFEFHISKSNNNVLNMLNVKYFIQGGQMRLNPAALGSVWLVGSVKEYSTATDEIRALGKKFQVSNAGAGQLVVNGKAEDKASVFGGETLYYVLPTGDSLSVPLSNGLTKGLKAVFVMDINGNTNLVPEITLQADTANSFARLVAMEVTEDFDPAEEVVMLKSEAAKLSRKKFTADGTIRLKSYAPNKLVYTANVKGEQLAVFSEIYYQRGWKATVNGKEQEILKVDYALRGLEIPSGNSTIEFTFDLPEYHSSATIAYIGSSLIVLLVIGLGVMEIRKKKSGEQTR